MSGAETVVVMRDCPRCVGFGTIAYFGDADVTCPDCGGSGRKRHRLATQADALAVMREAEGALADIAAEKPGARPRALRTLANLRAAIARMGGA